MDKLALHEIKQIISEIVVTLLTTMSSLPKQRQTTMVQYLKTLRTDVQASCREIVQVELLEGNKFQGLVDQISNLFKEE